MGSPKRLSFKRKELEMDEKGKSNFSKMKLTKEVEKHSTRIFRPSNKKKNLQDFSFIYTRSLCDHSQCDFQHLTVNQFTLKLCVYAKTNLQLVGTKLPNVMSNNLCLNIEPVWKLHLNINQVFHSVLSVWAYFSSDMSYVQGKKTFTKYQQQMSSFDITPPEIKALSRLLTFCALF